MPKPKQYSLFIKEEGKYKRVSDGAYPLVSARRIFQSALLAGSMRGFSMNLRPVRDGYDGLNPQFKLIPLPDEEAIKFFNEAVRPTA